MNELDNYIKTHTVKNILTESWTLLYGIKGACWIIIIIVMSIIFIFITAGTYWTFGNGYPDRHIINPVLLSTLGGLVLSSLYYISLLRIKGVKVSYKSSFSYIKKSFHAVSIYLLIILIQLIPTIILYLLYKFSGYSFKQNYNSSLFSILNGLYFAVTSFLFFVSIPLFLDQKYNPFKAMYVSSKLMIENIKITLPIFFLTGVIMLGSILIVTIIWLVPYYFMVCINLYQRLIQKDLNLNET